MSSPSLQLYYLKMNILDEQWLNNRRFTMLYEYQHINEINQIIGGTIENK
jgi:hypothetical protein